MANKVAVPEIAGSYEQVSVQELRSNPWNPNVQTDRDFEKLCSAIRRFGFGQPLIVREADDGYEVIDGEHRLNAARSLRMTQVPVINLGNVPDVVAKQLTILANELSGTSDQVRMSALLSDLAQHVSIDALREVMPFPRRELDSLIAALDYNLDRLPGAGLSEFGVDEDADEDGDEDTDEDAREPPTGKIKKLVFQLSQSIHAEMQTKLVELGGDPNALIVELIRNAHAEAAAISAKKKKTKRRRKKRVSKAAAAMTQQKEPKS